jgi:hypothetical protein
LDSEDIWRLVFGDFNELISKTLVPKCIEITVC